MDGPGWRRGWDSNPRGGFPPTPLAGERLRPLGHLSKAPVTGSAPAGQGAIAERSGPVDNGASLAGDTGMGSDWGGALADHMRRIAALRQVEMLLDWDRETQMPPKGSAQRAEQAAAVAEALHALESDPRLADWLAEAGARAAGAAAVNVARGGAGARAGDAGAGAARRRARPRRGRGADRLGRGARGLGLRRLRAGARPDRGAQARGGGLPRRRRRPLRRAARRLRARGDRRRGGGGVRPAAARTGRPAAADRRVGAAAGAARRATSPAPRSSRSRAGSPAPSATTGRRGGSTSPCIRPRPAPAATCGSPPASTRPTRSSACTRRSTRSGMRSTSRGSTRRSPSSRPAPTPRWGCTRASRGCSRTTSAAAAPSAAGWRRRWREPSAGSFGAAGGLRGGQRRRAGLHPHRRRRGALQPARHAALRPRAGADRGRPRGRGPRGGLERSASSPTSGSRCRTRAAGCCRTCTGRRRPSATSRPTRSGRSTRPSSTRRCAATSTSTPGWRRATSAPAIGWLNARIHRHGRLLPARRLIAEAIGREPDERALVGYLEAKFGALYGL